MSEYAGIETVPDDEAVGGLVQKGDEYPAVTAEADLEPEDEPVAGLQELVPPSPPDDDDD